MEPETWGFRAWSTLFGLASSLSTLKKPVWLRLVRLLPDILPCQTCRTSCAKFIEHHPPEKSLNAPLQWLCTLRRNVILRNSKSPDANRLDVALKACGLAEATDEMMIQRFAKRLTFPAFWVYDVFLFLSFIAMTLTWTKLQARQHWLDTLHCVDQLSPFPLHLDSSSSTPFPPITTETMDEALQSLFRSPACPTSALMPTLAATHVRIKS